MPTVAGTVTDKSGNTASWSASWTVQAAAAKKILGWHAEISKRDDKLDALVGGLTGIKAYRVYGSGISTNGQDQASQLTWCHQNNLMPIMSYKTRTNGFSLQQVINGALDSRVQAAATYLNSFGKTTYVALDHEPYDDFLKDGDQVAEYRAIQERLLPIFGAKPNLRVGPILHGFLLDNQSLRAERFDSFISQTLFDNVYDFFGIDSYQTGTAANPGPINPGSRMTPLRNVMTSFGNSSMPLLIGEFNAWEADVLDSAMNVMLNAPTLEVMCMWDRVAVNGAELTGERKAVYEDYKNNDPRILR